MVGIVILEATGRGRIREGLALWLMLVLVGIAPCTSCIYLAEFAYLIKSYIVLYKRRR